MDRPANVFAHPASYTTLCRHHKLLCIEIHRQGVGGAFRHTGMTPLSCRAEPMIDHRRAHSDIVPSGDRQQGISCTGRNTRHIVAEMAGNLVGENHRRPVLLMKDYRSMRTGFDTVVALRTAFKKERLRDGTWRTQPICPQCGRRLVRNRLRMTGVFLRRLRNREDGILEKIAPPVFGIIRHRRKKISNLTFHTNGYSRSEICHSPQAINYMTPSARSL